ncbi:unnamed protein product [Cladocopium goreaui]|uniref:Deoxyribodipyrimidine photo-lyase n=1 Tax=Cladocopium goreaui TaxID=2562237 RepID=A0A9P1G578_9DINO|nr:unnamed protein product [Cladocopium goreaui]
MEPTYQSPQFHGGDGIVTPSGSIETNLEGRCTLDEPVMETIMRDLRSIGTKLKYVMLPRARADKGAGLREWDLWGPLVLCLALGIMLSLHAEQALDLAELCGLLVALVSLFTDGRGGRSGQALRSHCLWRFSFDDALSLTDASARELANAAWACAKVTTAGLPCLERIATASLEMDPRPKFKGSFTAVDVAQLCWSLASLTVEVPWCRAAARWVTDQPATTAFPAQSVSTVAWALARGAAREGAKSEAAAAVELLLQGLEGDLEPRHWSNLSWAAAKVNAASLSPFLWHLPVEQLKQPQHLANVAWATAATAEISETADRLMPRIASQALQLGLHVFQDEELAGLLYGAASNHFVEERFLTEAQQEVASRCLGGVELAGIFWSLSVLSSASEPLRWEAANRAVELSPQGLANVAWACALQAWDAWATAGFLAAVKSHLKDFSPQGLVNLAWSWTEMEVHPGEEGALRKILLMAVERAEELKAMEFSSLLCSLAKSRRAEEAAALLRHLQRLEEPMGDEMK